ncbi:MAG: PD-(D/E)XK nuclease family protein [Thermodesulfobacterium sp.]|nr:PD-(D/E)XK nuclease family protein [Thermodesulfobacterium sp.]
MPVKLNQGKVSLRVLKEKTDYIILGEILHYIWENFLIAGKDFFSLSPDSEEFKKKVEIYIKKALAFYQEPLPQRKNISEKVKKIIEKIFKSNEFRKFKELIKKEDIVAIYREPEGFFKEDSDFLDLRPDIIIKKKDEWIILELKLHKEFDKTQLENYYTLLKKIFPNDNIKVYLISFEPFKVELIYYQKANVDEKMSSYPTQLPLFKNFN